MQPIVVGRDAADPLEEALAPAVALGLSRAERRVVVDPRAARASGTPA